MKKKSKKKKSNIHNNNCEQIIYQVLWEKIKTVLQFFINLHVKCNIWNLKHLHYLCIDPWLVNLFKEKQVHKPCQKDGIKVFQTDKEKNNAIHLVHLGIQKL